MTHDRHSANHHNMPYRGEELHGVAMDADITEDEATYWTGTPIEYAKPIVEPDPIPVHIVGTQGSREFRAFGTARLIVSPGNSVPVVGRNTQRTTCRITNMTTDGQILYIGDINVSPISGYPLRATESVELKSQDVVYAALASGGATNVEFAVLSEWSENQ